MTTTTRMPIGYFAVGRTRLYPLPAASRQGFLDASTGLIFRSLEPARFIEFFAGVGEWRALSNTGAGAYANVPDKYNSLPITRPEALQILRRLGPDRQLPD